METVKLFVADIDFGSSHEKFLFEHIKEEQRQKANAFKNRKDYIRCLLSSYLMNQLSDEPLLKNEMGKPYYENGPHFNVSHSGKYVLMAVSNKDIGVDIEENTPKDYDVILKLFNEVEVKMIKEHADFYYLWCAKESLIKCAGGSIGKIREIPSLPLNGLKTFKGIDYQSQTFIYDKHIVSITRLSNEPFEIKIERVTKLPLVIK